ncbi:MAG: hypothetical protein M3R04_03400 [bacterium]|nr:hypothetical protein [bacterium]
MSFRRYVGKTVRVTAQGSSGEVVYSARLFDYDDAGVWLHHSDHVALPGGRTESVDGLLFLPHNRIVNVFAFDGLDELMSDEVERQEAAGAARESDSADSMRTRSAEDKAVIDSVGAGTKEELEGNV